MHFSSTRKCYYIHIIYEFKKCHASRCQDLCLLSELVRVKAIWVISDNIKQSSRSPFTVTKDTKKKF
jgi:hypothetical protein